MAASQGTRGVGSTVVVVLTIFFFANGITLAINLNANNICKQLPNAHYRSRQRPLFRWRLDGSHDA